MSSAAKMRSADWFLTLAAASVVKNLVRIAFIDFLLDINVPSKDVSKLGKQSGLDSGLCHLQTARYHRSANRFYFGRHRLFAFLEENAPYPFFPSQSRRIVFDPLP